jgi:DNA repair protein REV1
MQAVSVDEALLDVGTHITTSDDGQEEALATKIRDEIRQATGCEASIGIGSNILIAR